MTASKISGPHTSREEKDVGRILTAIPSGGGKFAAVVSSNLPGGGGKTETNVLRERNLIGCGCLHNSNKRLR